MHRIVIAATTLVLASAATAQEKGNPPDQVKARTRRPGF
jgi:hypothetical protein